MADGTSLISLDKRIQEIGELRSRVEKLDGGAK